MDTMETPNNERGNERETNQDDPGYERAIRQEWHHALDRTADLKAAGNPTDPTIVTAPADTGAAAQAAPTGLPIARAGRESPAMRHNADAVPSSSSPVG